jgi:hypothetical protein
VGHRGKPANYRWRSSGQLAAPRARKTPAPQVATRAVRTTGPSSKEEERRSGSGDGNGSLALPTPREVEASLAPAPSHSGPKLSS